MDLLFAGFQGLGLALAAGMLLGAPGRRGTAGTALLVVALVAGAALDGLMLTTEDHPAWPGWPIGALAAALGFYVGREVAAGAGSRSGADAGVVSAMIAAAAVVVAALSYFVPPFAVVALVALIWLAIARRRRGQRKYEGLRTLR